MSDLFVKATDYYENEAVLNKLLIASVTWDPNFQWWRAGKDNAGAFVVRFAGGGVEYFITNPLDPNDSRKPATIEPEMT